MWDRAAGISWRGVICWGLDTAGEADYSGGRRNPPTPEPKAFTRQGLTKGFSEIQQALATFEAQDGKVHKGFQRHHRFTAVLKRDLGWEEDAVCPV